MQLISLQKHQTTKLFWVVVVGLVGVMLYTARQDDPGVVATALLLGIVAAYPLYLWLLGWSHGLPIWPVFALVNGTFAALPMIQDPETLDNYTSGEIMTGGVTLIAFIVLGTVVWLGMTGRQPSLPKTVLMVTREHSERYLFAFVAAGLFFQLNFLFWWVTFPGNTMSIVRGIALSLNYLGIFVLGFYAGRKILTRPQETLLVVMASATALAAAATLVMATAIVPVAMLLLGYALGSGKVPWKGMVAVVLLAAVLHPGKFAMRELYWGEERPPMTLLTMPQYFGDWLSYGLAEVGVLKSDGRDTEKPQASTLFERAGNVHMLLLVQKKSPDEVPFLGGITYEHIPRMLIPRIIDDGKGISHAGNVLLTVNYGVQTIEQTASTSIYWGLVPEAYANFGYLGVAALAVLLGLFYGYVTNLTVGVPMTSLRFVLGLLILGAATKADTMGVFVSSQFQGVVGVSFAALFLMRRQGNPFAAEGEETEHGAWSMERKKHGAWSRERKEHGAWSREHGARKNGERMNGPRDQETKRLKDEETAESANRRWPQGKRVAMQPTDKRQSADGVSVEQTVGKQLTADGGTVRTFPIKLPKRVAAWMPRRVRAAVVAQRAEIEQKVTSTGAHGARGRWPQATAGEMSGSEGVNETKGVGEEGLKDEELKRLRDEETKRPKDERARPRQVAVPYQNYRRYRSG